MDIKQQAIPAYLTESTGYRQLAKKYGMSWSTINKWVQMHQGIHNLPPTAKQQKYYLSAMNSKPENVADKSFKNLASFANEVLVECPHCNKRAVVFAEQGQYTVPYPATFNAKFRCTNCYKPLDEKLWYGPIVISPASANCGYCGNRLTFSKTVNKYQDKIEVKCTNCEQQKKYDVHYTLTYADSKQATDPYFGLQLWLQIPFDNNILWAYNFEHLAYVKNYVGAKLREAASGGKYSLAWKLPNFIKAAKNRDRILKAISRLEIK